MIASTASRTRINLTGAINLESMSVIHEDYETINGTTTVDFLRLLEVSYPDAPKIHLILDQSGYHRSNEVAELVKNSRIVLHFQLPPIVDGDIELSCSP